MATRKPLEEVDTTPEVTLSDEDVVKSQIKRGEKIESVMSLGDIINATIIDADGKSSIRKFTRD